MTEEQNTSITNQPVSPYKTFLIVCVVVWTINTLIYHVFFGYPFHIQELNPINIITRLNPLLHIGPVAHWIFNWSFIEYFNEGYYPLSAYIIGIPLWISGPVINFLIAKAINKKAIIGNRDTTIETSSSVIEITETIKNSFRIGMDNIGIIIGTSILWALTVWIPYLNVGTTIGLFGMIVSISQGSSVTATDIFNAKYRKNMGEFFLLLSFMIIGITTGYAFVIIPGIVISIAWSQSIYLLIDKELSPLEAISSSNRITYGEKFNIFISQLLLVLIIGIPISLCIVLLGSSFRYGPPPGLVLLFGCIGYLAFSLTMIGFSAYIYGQLKTKLDAKK